MIEGPILFLISLMVIGSIASWELSLSKVSEPSRRKARVVLARGFLLNGAALSGLSNRQTGQLRSVPAAGPGPSHQSPPAPMMAGATPWSLSRCKVLNAGPKSFPNAKKDVKQQFWNAKQKSVRRYGARQSATMLPLTTCIGSAHCV
jgi:hypothetical protein